MNFDVTFSENDVGFDASFSESTSTFNSEFESLMVISDIKQAVYNETTAQQIYEWHLAGIFVTVNKTVNDVRRIYTIMSAEHPISTEYIVIFGNSENENTRTIQVVDNNGTTTWSIEDKELVIKDDDTTIDFKMGVDANGIFLNY